MFNRAKYFLMNLIVIFSFLMITGCKHQQPPVNTKITQVQKAKAAANSISFTENAEIENIKKRLELTSDPGLTGFILLMNEAGQPIMYTGVVGKVTSGSKRLTQPFLCDGVTGLKECRWNDTTVTPGPSDEGTWGSSNPYIYFWTSQGQYMQWSGKYLYSDKPFRINIDPLVINMVPAKAK